MGNCPGAWELSGYACIHHSRVHTSIQDHIIWVQCNLKLDKTWPIWNVMTSHRSSASVVSKHQRNVNTINLSLSLYLSLSKLCHKSCQYDYNITQYQVIIFHNPSLFWRDGWPGEWAGPFKGFKEFDPPPPPWCRLAVCFKGLGDCQMNSSNWKFYLTDFGTSKHYGKVHGRLLFAQIIRKLHRLLLAYYINFIRQHL